MEKELQQFYIRLQPNLNETLYEPYGSHVRFLDIFLSEPERQGMYVALKDIFHIGSYNHIQFSSEEIAHKRKVNRDYLMEEAFLGQDNFSVWNDADILLGDDIYYDVEVAGDYTRKYYVDTENGRYQFDDVSFIHSFQDTYRWFGLEPLYLFQEAIIREVASPFSDYE